MKRVLFFLTVVVSVGLLSTAIASAQGSVKTGPDPSTIRDAELEKDSLHNLEVARHYFKLKKAYVAAIKRCEEIIAGNPTFAKIDEVLYIAGQSSLLLAEKKGKQSTKDKTPDQLRQDARDYLKQLVSEYPESAFRKQAEESLLALGPGTEAPEIPKDL